MIGTLSFMTNTCRISRKTETLDSVNHSPTRAWSTPTVDVPCSIQTSSGSEDGGPPVEQGKTSFIIYFPYGTDVIHSDRLMSFGNSPLVLSTDILAVTSPPMDHGGKGAYVAVTAVHTTGTGAR